MSTNLPKPSTKTVAEVAPIVLPPIGELLMDGNILGPENIELSDEQKDAVWALFQQHKHLGEREALLRTIADLPAIFNS